MPGAVSAAATAGDAPWVADEAGMDRGGDRREASVRRVDPPPVCIRGAGRPCQHGTGRGMATGQGLGDPLSLKRVHQTRSIADEQHPVVGRPGTDEAHLQPPAELAHRRLDRRIEQPEVHEMGAELVELSLGAMGLVATVTQADTEAEVGAIRAGEQPSVSGEATPRPVVPQGDDRQGNLGRYVAAHGETPQHSSTIDEPGGARRRAGGTIGADDHVGMNDRSSIENDTTVVDCGNSPGMSIAPASRAALRNEASNCARGTTMA